ncbi:MAG: helix-turn-helix domain-containing protein [Candidatus Binataceae bacterium]
MLGIFIAPRNEAEYDRAVETLNHLVDEIGDHPGNPRYRLIETLSTLVEAYDAEHHALPEADGRELLRWLMDRHGLSQSDLKDDLGGQGVASEVLSGKRDLNARQMKALGARFRIDPGAFI